MPENPARWRSSWSKMERIYRQSLILCTMKFSGSIENSAGESGVTVILQWVNCSRIAADEQISSLHQSQAGRRDQRSMGFEGAASPIDSRFTRKVGIFPSSRNHRSAVMALVRRSSRPPRCLTHLIVLRFADAFFEKLRTLAPSSASSSSPSESVACRPVDLARDQLPTGTDY